MGGAYKRFDNTPKVATWSLLLGQERVGMAEEVAIVRRQESGLGEASEEIEAALADRHAAAQAVKAGGGLVAGYLCDNLPEELFIAAGILPVRVVGDPSAGFGAVSKYLSVQPGFHQGSTAMSKMAMALAEQILQGTYSYLDYLIVPHTRKAIQELFSLLLFAKARHPDLPVPELYFLDRTYTENYASSRFNSRQVVRLAAQIEIWTGRLLDTESLRSAISLCNRSRALLRDFARKRAAPGAMIGGVTALRLFTGSMTMPKARFVELLDKLVSEEREPQQTQSAAVARLFLGGSPFDHPALYQAIEACGALIVAEDHCWGARCSDFPVDEELDPLAALSARYHAKPACSIAGTMRRTVDLSISRALASQPDGAIFAVQSGDTSQTWETPDEVARLKAAGIPCLHLHSVDYCAPLSDDALGSIRTFVSGLNARAKPTEDCVSDWRVAER